MEDKELSISCSGEDLVDNQMQKDNINMGQMGKLQHEQNSNQNFSTTETLQENAFESQKIVSKCSSPMSLP